MVKKLLTIVLLSSSMLLTGCSADLINTLASEAGEQAGIDIDLNLEQEDLDNIENGVKDAIGDIKDVAEDEEVQGAVSALIDALKNATEKSEESSDIEE